MSIKKAAIAAISALALLAPQAAVAAVNVTVQPVSLVTAPMLADSSSGQIALFSFTIGQTDNETLSSVAVTVNNAGSSTASGSDLASVSVYKDDGDGTFESGDDDLAGTQNSVNIGSATTVTAGSNNTLAGAGSKFFVTLATDSTWSDSSPADSVTVTLAANAIVTSADSPTVTAVTTDTITADISTPTLVSAVAKNTGGTSATEAGDSIELMFSESTNKPTINAGNIDDSLTLNNSHSFLDGADHLGSATWSVDGKTLTIVLSAGTSLPTVVVGDTVTVAGDDITDLAGNAATGTKTITGSFSAVVDGDDDDGDEEGTTHGCGNTLINGHLYKIGDAPTVYLAAACRLKPFRGAAVFHARGMKFQNITTLSAAPTDAVSENPVLPAEGTLIKGKDKTVWFVNEHGKRQGFVSADVFTKLGFSFGQVQTIEDTDLALIPPAENIENESRHPDGALIKCGNSASVFEVIGGAKFPFANAEAFQNRGHSFDHILNVDCGRFRYLQGAPVN